MEKMRRIENSRKNIQNYEEKNDSSPRDSNSLIISNYKNVFNNSTENLL